MKKHLPEARQALRVLVASLIAVGVTHVFKLPQGYWAVITAVIVIQASVGASVKTAVDRFMGSLVGAVAGVAVAAVLPLPETWALCVALIVAIPPTAWLAAMKPRYRMAPITAAIVVLTATGARSTIMTLAFQRVAEILIGNIIGVGTALLVLPARAHQMVADVAGRAITVLAELLDQHLSEESEEGRVDTLHAQLRATMAALDTAGDEAVLERKSRLTDESDPEPLVRAVRRLRNDVQMIGRAAAQAAPVPQLAAHRRALSGLATPYFRAMPDALRNRTVPPDGEALVAALRAYAIEAERLRAVDGLSSLQGPQIARLYAMGFALEQLALDVEQLSERTKELADTSAKG